MTLQQQASCKKTWACCDGYAFAHVPGPLWLVNSPHKYYFNCLQANCSCWIARDHESNVSTGHSRLKIKEVIIIYVKINIDSSQFQCMKQNSLKENKILFSVFCNLICSLYCKLYSFYIVILMTGNRWHSERPDGKELAFHKPLTLYQLKVAKYVFTLNYNRNALADTSHWKLLTILSKLVDLSNHELPGFL